MPPINLLLRSENGAALNSEQHDQNFIAIQEALNQLIVTVEAMGSSNATGIVNMIKNDEVALRSMNKALLLDLRTYKDPDIDNTNPTLFFTAIDSEDPNDLGVDWDPSKKLLADLTDARQRVNGLVVPMEIEKAVSIPYSITLSGSLELDLFNGPNVDISLTGNSTLLLGKNAYSGAGLLISVSNTGAFTLAINANPDVQPEAIGDIAVGSGAGVKTTYAVVFLTATRYKIVRVGVVPA